MKLQLRCFVCLLSFTLAFPGNAEELPRSELEASYLLNFIQFAEWPQQVVKGGGDVTVCVVGSKRLGRTLSEMEGHKIGSQVLRVVPDAGSTQDLRSCQVVYLGASVQRQVPSVLKALGDTSALTISTMDGFAQRGGCIGLLYREGKMRFEINLAAAKRARLHLPSQMLNLAANVFAS